MSRPFSLKPIETLVARTVVRSSAAELSHIYDLVDDTRRNMCGECFIVTISVLNCSGKAS